MVETTVHLLCKSFLIFEYAQKFSFVTNFSFFNQSSFSNKNAASSPKKQLLVKPAAKIESCNLDARNDIR